MSLVQFGLKKAVRFQYYSYIYYSCNSKYYSYDMTLTSLATTTSK